MIKPNWDIFKTKFSENPQDNFEWFCYLLFCIEHNKHYGVFRYKDQSGIETDPIQINNKIIGWQAKFYDDKLSTHEKDLISTLEKSKRDYPGITNIILYTNVEWTKHYKNKTTKATKTTAQINTESKAHELNIEIKWRTASYFESPFVSIENSDLSSHFFKNESIYDEVEEKKNYTQFFLNNINTQIEFNSEIIELNRLDILKDLEEKLNTNQILIVSGVGGVGKTSIIKSLYQEVKENTPYYLFKANEFNKSNINELFGKYSIEKFIDVHQIYDNKIIVIDSSEKLLDHDNLDVFKEFLDSFVKNKWKIIFTTRNSYLEDLNYQFIDIMNIQPFNIKINNLESKELVDISKQYKFNLPNDNKLEELIRNPFYLNEYLISYTNDDQINYEEFKQKIWDKKIRHPHIEQCFFKLAFERANKGEYYINNDCASGSLEELRKEGILTYEKSFGDFISHDIYEEWALERIINKEFLNRKNEKSFFEIIGSSLPIRRALRSWVSEKLLLGDENIIKFIEDIIDSKDIESFWKDEIFISILLSNYSDTFFEIFERELKENSFKLLNKLASLLQLSCKEVDNSLFELYKISSTKKLEMFQLLNMPKGNGWKSFITFVFNNIETIKLENINIILPLLLDWNKKNKKGETTRFASLLALHYYKLIYQDKYKYNYNESIEKICNIVISGANEIKQELEEIFKDIIENKLKSNRDNYYELSIKILSTWEGLPLAISILKIMPNYVLKLANLFWTNVPMKEDNSNWLSDDRDDIENAYELDNNYKLKCFPSSAYQTPIYYMLHIDFSNTIDFVLEFINKSVEHYVKSTWKYKEAIQTINLQIDDKITIDQYHSSALWNTFRGTSSPISPYLLQSIHMALETYLLEVSKDLEHDDLEKLLANILYKSKSSSISAIIASVVLAYPSKTTNIAIALFKTKEFIQSDFLRQIKDMSVKSQYSMGYGLNKSNTVHIKERVKTCDDKHRKSHLEKQFLDYQYYKLLDLKSTDKESANKLIDNLYKILDTYKAELDADKDITWQIALSRMDMRDMDIKTKRIEDSIQITVNHELPPELKKHSEIVQKESSDTMKYLRVNLWSSNKVKNHDDCKNYSEFEENPMLALNQIKEILDIPKVNRDFILPEEIFPNVSVCLLKYYKKSLSKGDIEFCKDLILEFSKKQFFISYHFQFSDGTESALSNLPILLEEFPNLNNDIKIILLFSLFNDYEIGMSGVNIHDYPINAIVDFYDEKEINDFILGYLFLKPKYDLLYLKLRKENYQIDKSDVITEFFNTYEDEIEKFVINEITIETIDFNMDFVNLSTIFKFIKSSKVKPNDLFKKLSKISILRVFQPKKRKEQSLKNMTDKEKLDKIFRNDKKDYENIDFGEKQSFFDNLPYLIYKLDIEDITKYLQPLLDNFNDREDISYLLLEFILVEDILKEYDKFWHIWTLFEDKVTELCENGRFNYTNIIIKTYLLAWSPHGQIWNSKVKEWHSLRDKDKRFLKRISIKIGHYPSTLYSISKLLTSIGSIYLNDGILWISNMLRNNANLSENELEVNTINHIETLIKKYILENTEKIKKERKTKEDVLVILNFLIKKESPLGYMLRERI